MDVVKAADLSGRRGGYQNWAGVLAFYSTFYPSHLVLSGGVYDDSCSAKPPTQPTMKIKAE